MNLCFRQSPSNAFPSTMRLLMRVCSALLAILAIPGVSIACTPPAAVLDAGFYRDNVTHLPQNARGVMFFLPSIKPKVSDFKLTSPDDKRPLALRLRRSRDGGTIRLEPIGGFAPKARYSFQYLPVHERWRYPDRVSVMIDEAVVDTAGTYAIELAPQPEVRMIVVPGSPACIEPVVAVTQPISYRVPPTLAAYRTMLEYGTFVRTAPQRHGNREFAGLAGWPFELTSYYAGILWWNRTMIDKHSTGADDIILASCDQRHLRGKLIGSVAFPEVDDNEYRVAPVTIDLSRNIFGKCRPLDALTQTMRVYGAEKALETVCSRTFPYDLEPADVAALTGQWEQAFSILYDLSPTCRLVTLAHLLNTRQYVPDRKAMHRLGAALAEGLQRAQAVWLSDRKPIASEPMFLQSVDGLDYMMRSLPANLRPDASALLLPLLPQLAAHLGELEPYRPDAVAALIVHSGSLPADVRARIMSIAQGRAIGARHARAILAAQPHTRRTGPLDR